MFMPVYPQVLEMPFAANGDKASIPALPTVFGRASLSDGFPLETQAPLNAGGVPPSRVDVNGALFPVYVHAMWQQSGGMFLWSETLNYVSPCAVWYDGRIFVCRQGKEMPSGPDVAGVGPKQPGAAGSEDYWLDYATSITPPPAEKYDMAQYYWFEDEMERPGLFSCLGGVVHNFAAKYPKAAAYFATEHAAKRLVTQAEYDALHVAIWHTCADGTKIGWDGIGGVHKFVWDKEADTLLLPDLAGMTPEMVGYDALGVGDVHGWGIPEIAGTIDTYAPQFGMVRSDATTTGAFDIGGNISPYFPGGGSPGEGRNIVFSTARTSPVAAKVQTRAWGSLACVYLGRPAT